MDIKKTFEKYIDIFEKNFSNVKQHESSSLYKIRTEAYEKFKKHGMPDHNDENYKYAGISEICSQDYEFSLDSRGAIVDLNEYFQCEIKDLDTHIALLSNGEYYSNNKPIENIGEGVIICGLNMAINKYPEIIKEYYNQNAREYDDSFSELNTMFAKDGLFIYVPENTKIDKTIQLVNLIHGFGNKNIFKRNLIIVRKNSELSLVICDHTLNNSNNFVIDVTESVVLENAKFCYHNLQKEPNKTGVINSHFVKLNKYSKFDSYILSFHGGIIRNNLFVKMIGEFAESNLFGLNLTDREQRIDNYTLIEHDVPNCSSNELYKGILDEQAKGSFMGRIIVKPNAQKTLAYQTNRNICLTPEAKMRTKPQLEIYADDVKCSHGATVGQLDETALFYLKQRGINEKEAKLMLMFAFANDILLKINIVPLRERIAELIDSRLRGEFSACEHCLMNCNSR
ncbi:MAG TPA: Fe-S cluster assembly protein SufD [Bacteroidales bacterium]|nr:Fe-S cluster assembly protein SufD [Bacteroidales bacterium]